MLRQEVHRRAVQVVYVGALIFFKASTAAASPSVTEDATTGPEPVEATCGARGAVTVQKIRVQEGDGLWRVLRRAGVAREDVAGSLAALAKLGNLDVIPPGRELVIKSDEQGRMVSLEQRPAATITQCVERADASRFVVRTLEIPIETRVELVSGLVRRSLGATLESIGEKPALGYLLRELFMVRGQDLFTKYPRDVRFRAVVEKRMAAEELVGYGQILAAELTLPNGKRRRAFYYAPENGEPGYYTGRGRLISKPMLRMPIAGAQITSAFGVREHPLSGKAHAHLGIDFAGLEGCEVRAARDGVVEVSHNAGDLGNFVSIKHDGDLVTRYAHLRGFAPGLYTGRWVAKGTLIGYVGRTGLTTGPHLHFEAIAGGMHLDPARFFGGPGRRLEEQELALFHVATAQLAALFRAIEREPLSTVALR